MKIAFVNQPIDAILPPKQSSVGACTFGTARPLAHAAQVLVYGLLDHHAAAPRVTEPNLEFRFIPSTMLDRLLFKLQNKSAKLIRRSTPISTSRWMFPGYGRRVALDLQKQGVDVIHLQHCSQYIEVMRALNPKAKIVLHLHGEWFSQSDPSILEKRLGKIDLLTTVSNYVTEKTRRTFPSIADRCETTDNGIDAAEFAREPDYAARKQRTVKRILYAGAVSPHKGIHILLDAFIIVARQYPNVMLDIVGPVGNYPLEENFDLADQDTIQSVARFYPAGFGSLVKAVLSRRTGRAGAYLEYLKRSLPAELSGKVSFLGMVPRSELVDRYYAADVFAFAPIWDEGFGLPPLEAMAAGVPVVATRSGALVETIVQGQTGILVDKNNVEELAQAILLLLCDDARSEAMGRAGRRRALDRFTWDRVAEGMHNRYRVLYEPAMGAVHR